MDQQQEILVVLPIEITKYIILFSNLETYLSCICTCKEIYFSFTPEEREEQRQRYADIINIDRIIKHCTKKPDIKKYLCGPTRYNIGCIEHMLKNCCKSYVLPKGFWHVMDYHYDCYCIYGYVMNLGKVYSLYTEMALDYEHKFDGGGWPYKRPCAISRHGKKWKKECVEFGFNDKSFQIWIAEKNKEVTAFWLLPVHHDPMRHIENRF